MARPNRPTDNACSRPNVMRRGSLGASDSIGVVSRVRNRSIAGRRQTAQPRSRERRPPRTQFGRGARTPTRPNRARATRSLRRSPRRRPQVASLAPALRPSTHPAARETPPVQQRPTRTTRHRAMRSTRGTPQWAQRSCASRSAHDAQRSVEKRIGHFLAPNGGDRSVAGIHGRGVAQLADAIERPGELGAVA